MKIREAIQKRIEQLCKEKNMTPYSLSYQSAIPSSTLKSIVNGKSKNPGIVNIKKIAEGFGISIKEFFDSELFDDLEQEE